MATAETLTSGSGGDNAATITTLAGAVIAKTQPPPKPRRAPLLAIGGLAAAGIAVIAFASTRGSATDGSSEVPGEPKLGLATIAEGRDSPHPRR